MVITVRQRFPRFIFLEEYHRLTLISKIYEIDFLAIKCLNRFHQQLAALDNNYFQVDASPLITKQFKVKMIFSDELLQV